MENEHGDLTGFVCFHALYEAILGLEKARLRHRLAAHALRTIRERLDQALETAYRLQSFGPLESLFDEEEMMLAIYERASSNVAEAQKRWRMLKAALAYEQQMMQVGPLSGRFLN